MLRIQKLVRPTKHSGYALPPGESTEVKGLTIVNRNNFPVYIDKQGKRRKVKTKKR